MPENKDIPKKLRIDMVIADFQMIDEEKGLFKMCMVPDPRFWEKKIVDGKTGFWHKEDKIFLSEEALKRAAPSLAGKPIYIENIGLPTKEYLQKSRDRIAKRGT
jgi:hypothetical protein